MIVKQSFSTNAATKLTAFEVTSAEASTARNNLNQCINLAKYSWLSDLPSPQAQAAITAAKEAVQKQGVAFFPDFITPSALADCVKECDEQNHDLFDIDDAHSLYYKGYDPAFPADHIRDRTVRTQVSIIPYARLSPQRSLQKVDKSPLLIPLLSQILD